MKKQLRKRAAVSCISLVMVCASTQANSNWSVAKPTEANVISVNTTKPKRHVLQIFSSINPTKAQGMKNTLEMHGYPAFIRVQAKPKQPYYQVHVGPFNSRMLAYNAKNSIIQLYPEFPFLNDAILKISLHH